MSKKSRRKKPKMSSNPSIIRQTIHAAISQLGWDCPLTGDEPDGFLVGFSGGFGAIMAKLPSSELRKKASAINPMLLPRLNEVIQQCVDGKRIIAFLWQDIDSSSSAIHTYELPTHH